MDENLKPIQIKIVASGTEEAVKSINSVTSALRELQKVSKSVSNSMSSIKGLKGNIFNFGNLDIDQSKVYDKSKTEIKNYKNYVENLDKSTKNYNRTLNKNTQVVENNYKQISKMFNGSSSRTLKLFGSIYATNKAVKYLSEAFDESASWVENLNVMEVAFKGFKKSADGLSKEFVDLSKDAYNFVSAISSQLGLNKNELLEYVSLFQQMASAMGQTTDTAYMMSTALTLIGTDVASLYNKDTRVTMEALRSAIAGQVKPVRQFGFDITSYSIDGLIEQMGILEGYTSRMMTQSQKQLARTILLIQQSKNAWGDLGKTLDTYSNQQKILSAQFTNLKRALGDLFIGTGDQAGIAAHVLYVLNGLIMTIVETIRYFIPEASSSGLNSAGEEVKDLNQDFKDLDETINGSLLSFDKFNTLSKGNEGTGNAFITSELEKLLNEEYNRYLDEWNKRMESVSSKAHEIRDSIMDFLGFTKESVTTVDELGNKFTTVKFTLKEGYTNLELIKDTLILITSILVSQAITNSFKAISLAVINLITNFNALKIASVSLATVGIFFVIHQIIELIKEWKNLSKSEKTIRIVLISLVGAFSLVTLATKGWGLALASLTDGQVLLFGRALMGIKNVILNVAATMKSGIAAIIYNFKKLQLSIAELSVSFAGLVVLIIGIATLVNNWDEMAGWQKVVTILGAVAAAAMSAAIAIGVFHASWTMGLGVAAIVAGVGLVLGTLLSVQNNMPKIPAFAKGGYPDKGSMFIANEKGPELVGNIGGRTAVANNDMIVTAIENASYQGMVRAMSTTSSSNNVNLKIDANSNDLSRALAKSMAIEFRRQGYKI
jgi:methyl-accepting chemotaxis protein